jgi:2-polyprenyl-3-methyl-5-hydroxy-6-metoxy-1,4-benzoquinol methylase
MNKSIEDVRGFWEATPLFSGESQFKPGTKEYFEEHRDVYISDCFAGEFDEKTLPDLEHRRKVLDLGCGPGFWTIELSQRGCGDLVAADLTDNALKLARLRCEQYGIKTVSFSKENAEELSFNDNTFSHVNCQGVIHHTPNTENAVSEIARVLEKGGTANISVYYRNVLLRNWNKINWAGKIINKLGGGLKGRGRENIYAVEEIDEIVRLYDGDKNPIGKSYTHKEFIKLVEPYFLVEETFLHFFPARSLPIKIPQGLHRYLDKKLGFMIYARLRKR